MSLARQPSPAIDSSLTLLSFFGTGEKGKKAPQLAQSTQLREAYFLDYAERIRQATHMPLMVTGGFRSVAGMNHALSSDALDAIGLGRPLCVDTDIPNKLISGECSDAPRYELGLQIGPGILITSTPNVGIAPSYYESVMASKRDVSLFKK